MAATQRSIDPDIIEALKQTEDFELFARTCLTIRTKEGALERLKLSTSQKFIHAIVEKQLKETGKVRSIIVKGRQQYVSTYVGARFYHKVTRNFGVRAFILTHLQETTDALFEMVERFHQHNNPLFKPATGKANAKELHFPGLDSGYRIGTAGSTGVGLGQTIQFFHGSEASRWKMGEEHGAGVMQAVPNIPGTEIILESTAFGFGGFFADQWNLAVAGESEFIPIFVPWFWQTEYRLPVPAEFELSDTEAEYAKAYSLDNAQMAWRRATIAVLKEQWLFQREYPATAEDAFQASGEGNYIKPITVAKARKTLVTPESYVPIIIGIDPARGGRDTTAVIDRQGRRAGHHICEEWTDADAMTLAGKIVLLINRLKPKKVCIDATEGTGAAIYDRLNELGYGKFIEPVKFSASAIEEALYLNKRAEMHAALKDWLNSPLGVQIPDRDDLQAQICAAIWGPGATRHNSNGQLQIEAKEHIVKRLKRSPDMNDALINTFAIPIATAKPAIATAHAAVDVRAGY